MNEILSSTIEPEVRDYQVRIFKKMFKNWEDGLSSQLIVSPTGAGKTFMGLQGISDLLVLIEEKEGIPREEVGIGWSAMRSNLLVQANEENQKMVGLKNFHTISIFDKNPTQLDKYKRKIVVYDEAHHSCTQSAVDLNERICPHYAIGLSATPLRADKMHLSFQVTINDGNYHRLIQDGYLSQFDHFTMKGGWFPENIARVYLRNQEQWGKSIFFFHTESECNRLSQIYKNCGVDHELITGSTDRFAQLERFESGEIDVLINMLILTEGFNCPSLKSVFIRDSKSKSVITQMGGRVLRKFPGIPQKQIIQSENSRMPFTRIAKAHRLFFEQNDKWAAVGISETVEQMSALMQDRMIKRFTSGATFGNEKLADQGFKNRSKSWAMGDAKAPGIVIFTASEAFKTREKHARNQKGRARAIYGENPNITRDDFVSRMLDEGLTEQLASMYFYGIRREFNSKVKEG
jgi:superfamily II DNA or RNA helicase